MHLISAAYIVRAMPAMPLTPEMLADAAKLRAHFKEWQHVRKAAGLPWSQESAAAEFEMGQSALNQYLNGIIPLNMATVVKLSRLLGVAPATLAPNVVAAENERAKAWAKGFSPVVKEFPRLELPTAASPEQAHVVSETTPKVESKQIDWGDLMTELPQAFELVVRDDSMAPLAMPGNIVRFKLGRTVSPGKRVLVMDKDDVPYIREYRLRRGDHWQAVALNNAYEPLDSIADGLRILAVMTGIDWE